MSAEVILEEYAEEMGRDDRSKILLLCQYIDNQASNDAFEDFLVQQRQEELDAATDYEDSKAQDWARSPRREQRDRTD